jgi:type VI secretion system secreted protein Hcp
MDLILLQPGDPQAFAGHADPALAARLAGGAWEDSVIDPARCIVLSSLQNAVRLSLTTDISTNARSVGRPSLSEITCVKPTDDMSGRLYDFCLRAQPLGEGADQPTWICILRDIDGVAAPVMVCALRDALISEIDFRADDQGRPCEQLKLNFTEILWTHSVPSANGRPKIAAGWSVARSRPISAFTRG